MTTRSLAWVTLGFLGMTTAGCWEILGLNHEYEKEEPVAVGVGGAGGTGSTGSTGSSGDASSNSSSSSGSAGGSCAGLPSTCGVNKNEDCCSTMPVPGGTFQRDNKDTPEHQATVSAFKLDRFEVTVGRFRQFVEAYPGSKPAEGAGKHPKIAEDKGWEPQWSEALPGGRAALEANLTVCSTPTTWTPIPSSNENKPINCVTWFEAFAFCIWDGGRLPTEAEWSYAAIGGDEARPYPWGPSGPTPGTLVYNCEGDGLPAPECDPADIFNVGSFPNGDGRWGQADLGASMREWLRDTWDIASYPKTPCVDCAVLDTAGIERVIRGGSWFSNFKPIVNDQHAPFAAGGHSNDIGLRCARD